MTFYDFKFEPEIEDSLDSMRFETPTPVQEQTIPIIMEQNDLIACAQTGTGKTAAYLLPTINRLIQNPHDGIDTIILVPTRELALQIDQQMEGFAYFVSVSSTAIYGGNDSGEWGRQRTALQEGADIVIATPGRMLQHISMGYVDFSRVKCLILDEADRMLDMGFFDDIMQVVKQLPVETRQTLMFSATMPPKIREMAKQILRSPKEINIAISKPAEGIRQGAYVVYEAQKTPLIKHLLKDRESQSIIVFSSRKQTCKELARELKRNGINADVIHSDLEQKEREEALLKFRSHQTNVLVATDIIARGIDIEKIDMVINFEVPHDAEDYVHRVGRTARAQTQGEAYTLISEAEMKDFGDIESLIETVVEKIPLPEQLGDGPVYDPKKRVQRNNRRNTNASLSENRQHRHGEENRERNRKRRKTKRADGDNSTKSIASEEQTPVTNDESEMNTNRKKKKRHHHRRNNNTSDNNLTSENLSSQTAPSEDIRRKEPRTEGNENKQRFSKNPNSERRRRDEKQNGAQSQSDDRTTDNERRGNDNRRDKRRWDNKRRYSRREKRDNQQEAQAHVAEKKSLIQKVIGFFRKK
ncbi:MAG: DEAD/DEAH box helicase [Marinilabiliaceae bacterium]|nr:DEAD/DEAH box helicase [Marinilabiliaceae bacterium]